jgi:hypothetical protein
MAEPNLIAADFRHLSINELSVIDGTAVPGSQEIVVARTS